MCDGILLRAISSDKKQTINADFSADKVSFGSNLNSSKKIQWRSHANKHKPPKNFSWNDIIKQTKHGDAKYKPDIDIEKFERTAWEKGTQVTNGKNWRVMKSDFIIGAKSGMETPYVRIEMSANTIHGHPITFAEYQRLLK